MVERSENARKGLLVERPMKNERSKIGFPREKTCSFYFRIACGEFLLDARF
jgi:hypothetical protein